MKKKQEVRKFLRTSYSARSHEQSQEYTLCRYKTNSDRCCGTSDKLSPNVISEISLSLPR